MSKPKIFAFCDAGCKWETIHRDEFLASATFAELPQTDGAVAVDASRKYRVYADKTDDAFNCTVVFKCLVGGVYFTQATIPVSNLYRGYFDIEVLKASYTSTGTDSATLEIIYEMNGTTQVVTNSQASNIPLDGAVLAITGANNVYLFNDSAEIIGKNGDGVFIRYSANADGSSFTETWTDGQYYIGVATGQEAPTDKSGYTWVRFVADGASSGGGTDGVTPHIGENGNWYIGDTDTGVKAQGEDGVSPTVTVSKSGTTTTITVTNADGTTTTAEVEDGEDGGSGIAESVEIFLNDEDVAVVGHEYNLYHYAVCHGNKSYTDYDIAVTLSYTNDSGSKVYQAANNYAECFRFTPTEARDYTLTYRVRDRKITGVIAEKEITLHAIEDTAVSGKNVLFIGDSFTDAGIWPAEIQHNLSNGGIISVGTVSDTRTIGGVSLTVVHEGRSGWATWDYAGTSSSMRGNFESAKNVFRNPDTDKFDLGYYMDTYHAGVTLNAVCIFLGTNGLGAITSTTNGMTELIARIREYDSTIPILLHYTIQHVGQDYWSKFYPQHNNTRLYRQNLWREQYNYYKSLYAGMDNVYIVPVYQNLDYDLDFPHKDFTASARNTTTVSRVTDGHPSDEGYLKMADVYYAYLLRYMRDGEQTYYSVTNNLTNVTNSNGATAVVEGAAYDATLTAGTGYTLSEVSVTMGGEAVSVTDGVVSIASVTGNIIITATAVADDPAEEVDNLADPTKIAPADTTPTLTDDYWWDGYYISSKVIKPASDLVMVNKIPMTKDQTITIEGFDYSENVFGGSTGRSRFKVLFCKEDGTACATEIQPASTQAQVGTPGFRDYMDQDLIEQGIFKFSPADTGLAYLLGEMAFARICGHPVDGDNSNVIVTVSD